MSDSGNSEARAVHQRYLAALDTFSAGCRTTRGHWFGQAEEFIELRTLLIPHAEGGNPDCQYALASIAFLGLCCRSQEEFEASHKRLEEEAVPWCIAAARQGCWWAVDNLLVSGKGPEADRARAMAKEVQRDSAHLIGHDASSGMPIYGPEFMQEVTCRLYGVVRTGNE